MKTSAGHILLSWLKKPLQSAAGNRLSQIGIAFIIVLSVALIGDQVRTALKERANAVAEANLRLRNLAQAVAAHADSALSLADITGAGIALQLEHDGTTPASLLRLQRLARAELAGQPVLSNLVIIDEAGSRLMSTTAGATSKGQYADRDYFIFHRSNPDRSARVGHPIRGFANGRWVIPVSRRFDHADGRFAGVVVGSIELDHFEVFYRSLTGYKGGSIGMYFDDRSLLGSNRARLAGDSQIDATLEESRLGSTTAVNAPPLATGGQPARQFGHAHLKHYGLVAVASAPSTAVLTQWRESTWHSALTSLLRLTVLFLLGAILIFQMRSRRKAETVLDEKAKQFRLVIDRIEDYGIYTLDTAGIIRSWNAGARRLTGYTAEDVIGAHCSTLYSAEDVVAGHPERTLADALRTGRKEDERKRPRKDGTCFLVNVITTPLFDSSGQHYGFLKVGRDVTTSRQSEALLEASEFRWKFALEGAGEGVWDWNLQTDAIDFSRPYMTMLGYEENEIEGSFAGWKALVHPDDLKGVYAALSAGFEDRTPNVRHEYRIRCRDGHYKWVAALGMVVSRDAQGKPLRSIGTQVDISQLKAAEQRLIEQNALMKQTNAQLQQANQVKSDFLANMSHELRTPLNAVLGFTGTLLMELPGPLNADQKKQLEAVRNSGRHLLELINEILDLSKIESGVMEVSCREFKCQDLIAEVAHFLMPLATEKAIRLSLELPDEAIHICSDPRLVKQILINLIGNAIKFTEAGSVTVHLSADRAVVAYPVTIDVSDTGIGIDERDLGKLFQPFTQLESGLARRFEGTGLGLNLSKKYADLLGAQLRVRSVRGEGTTFSLELPLLPAQPEGPASEALQLSLPLPVEA